MRSPTSISRQNRNGIIPVVNGQSFYQTPWVAEALVEQFRRRYVTMRWDFGMRRHYNQQELQVLRDRRTSLWGHEEEPFFEVHSVSGNVKDPTDLTYFVSTGVQEFIPEVSEVNDLDRTDIVIVDLDPKSEVLFTLDHTRWATKVVYAAMTVKDGPLDSAFGIQASKFRFSGNRSFHIYSKLKKRYPLNDIRQVLKETMEVVHNQFPVLSAVNSRGGKEAGPARTDFILIDIGAMSRHRCVRSLWSLHAKTGKVCVPVQDVDKFNIAEATQEAVLAKGPTQEAF